MAAQMQTNAFIAGAWLNSTQRFSVRNPATGQVIANVSDCSVAAMHDALAHAKQLWQSVRVSLASDREQWLLHWEQLLMQQQSAIASLLSQESGKPLHEAMAEVAYAASFARWFAGEARRIEGDVLMSNHASRQLINRKQPIGIVAAITPWNFPAAMVTRKVAAAIAAGCPVLLKPSELTPLTALMLAQLFEQTGAPAGMLQVITTSDAALFATHVCQDEAVAKITFTGSTRVGLQLAELASQQLKKISLELGGNAPAIVCDDADLAQAVQAIIAAKFRNAGQTCVCINRVLVQASIAPAFYALLQQQLANLTVGPASDAKAQIGPLIRPSDVTRLQQWCDEACNAGARRAFVSSVPDAERYAPVTMLLDVPDHVTLWQHEQFGPVLAIRTFSDDADALAQANSGVGGLAGYVFSQNSARIWALADGLTVGMVGMNETAISDASIPFGGVGLSGMGREGSRYGIDEYLQLKHLCWRL